jgi:hypothetical protein
MLQGTTPLPGGFAHPSPVLNALIVPRPATTPGMGPGLAATLWMGRIPSHLPGFGGGEAAECRLIEEREATITSRKCPYSTSATTGIRLERSKTRMSPFVE